MIIEGNFKFEIVPLPTRGIVIDFHQYNTTTILFSLDSILDNLYDKYINNIPVLETGNVFCNQKLHMVINPSTINTSNMLWGIGDETLFIGNNFNSKLFNSIIFDSNMKLHDIVKLPLLNKLINRTNNFISIERIL